MSSTITTDRHEDVPRLARLVASLRELTYTYNPDISLANMLELLEDQWAERSGVKNPDQKYPVKPHLIHKSWWKIGDRELYNADPECDHELTDGNNGSGVQCRRCSGWFCF